ncbi:hypothetical protein MNBD_NITROSPINAE01-1424 [hydrothermal vent metagenome]|uniref:Uncharacterized protein n=1 Tax=hydrothermal vent metagenome TaxID=652676 RepID=A0A3B1BLI9_9ZZZZ
MGKKIGLQTWGTDGDIRPFVALSGGLASAGYDVTLVVTSIDGKDYTQLATALGFRIIHTGGIPEGMHIEMARKILKIKNLLKQMKVMFGELFEPGVDEIYSESKKLCAKNDAVVGHHFIYPLRISAELNKRPYATVFLCHGAIATKGVAPPGLPNLGPFVNNFLWRAGERWANANLSPMVNRLRVKEGLEPVTKVFGEGWASQKLNLIAVSETLCERPPDWGDHHKLCGFFRMPGTAEKWEPPASLKDFLAKGDKPVYLTFGSMLQFDLQKMTQLMVDAAELAGVRAIIQADWDKVNGIPESRNIYRIGKTPHDLIFPFCSMVVHHGGSGTTQASLLAGLPSVVVEHGFDQNFWGLELLRVGVTGRVLHRRSVTAKKLAMAIREVVATPDMAQTAKNIGHKMRDEDGVKKAVRFINENLF